MKIRNLILINLCLFFVLVRYAAADNITVPILVKFNVQESSLLSSESLGDNYKMSCSGEDHAYSISSAVPSTNGLNIYVTGIFDGDKRDKCSIYDFKNKNTNDVYFSVFGLPIYFTYNGVFHSCFIEQNVGTSHDEEFGQYDKLQAGYTDQEIPCQGLISTDTYKITAGHDQPEYEPEYEPGDITINVK